MGKIPGSPYEPRNLFPAASEEPEETLEEETSPNGSMKEDDHPYHTSETYTQNYLIGEGKQPPPGRGESRKPIGIKPLTPEPSNQYSFLKVNPDNTPVTFSPCRPIYYVMRIANAPIEAQEYIKTAVSDVSAATGLIFVYDGLTNENPDPNRSSYQPELYGEKWAPILFAWTTEDETRKLSPDQIGEARNYILTRDNGYSHYISGQITLDATRLKDMEIIYGKEAVLGVIRHELGHLVGLGHVDFTDELMHPMTQEGLTNFQLGDLNGLYQVGQGTCAPDL